MAMREATFDKLVMQLATTRQKLQAHQETCENLRHDLIHTERHLRSLECDRKRLVKELKAVFAEMED